MRRLGARPKRRPLMSATEYNTTRIVYFVLDIGKNVHWLVAYTGPQQALVVAPRKVRTNQAGFDQTAELLQGVLSSGQFDVVMLGHEPTGIYHEAFSRALQARFTAYLSAST